MKKLEEKISGLSLEYKEISIEQITKSQAKKLIAMRMVNQKAGITIQRIVITQMGMHAGLFRIVATVYSNEWAPYVKVIYCDKFYPNEFDFLKEIGVCFKQ